MAEDLKSRVEREKTAHTDEDVLGNAYKLKGIFSHTVTSPTMRRMHAEFESILDEVRGRRVLEIGCGRGDFALKLLSAGAEFVAGIDISENYVADATAKANAAGFGPARHYFSVMDAHKLEFLDGQFDYVVGHGILHHLDLDVCLAEVRRVLQVGGCALFIEPLAGNPFLRLFRVLTPKARTVDEKPLDLADLRRITVGWDVASRYYGMISAPLAAATSLLLRPYPDNSLLVAADWVERKLKKVAVIQSLHQYVTLVLRKR